MLWWWGPKGVWLSNSLMFPEMFPISFHPPFFHHESFATWLPRDVCRNFQSSHLGFRGREGLVCPVSLPYEWDTLLKHLWPRWNRSSAWLFTVEWCGLTSVSLGQYFFSTEMYLVLLVENFKPLFCGTIPWNLYLTTIIIQGLWIENINNPS